MMNNSEVDSGDREELENGLCPDCQEAYMKELVDDYDGHHYLRCPNINCLAKIWISNFYDDDE